MYYKRVMRLGLYVFFCLFSAPLWAESAFAPMPPLHIERELVLKNRETLTEALVRAGLNPTTAHLAAHPLQKEVALRKLRPGATLNIRYAEETPGKIGKLEELSFIAPGDKIAVVTTDETGDFTAEVKKRELNRIESIAIGEIRGSLYESAQKANLPAALVPAFANVFAYDLDFTRDIQPGDQFRVVFEEVQDKDGNYVRSGNILAAELTLRGKTLDAYRFTLPNGQTDYYTANGKPKRKLLLRTPLEFTRISSNFNLNRKHPVLGYTRAHRGTDFAAPTGTPVKAAGSGVIERANRYGSFGNYVRIRHNGTYKTAYAHLHRIARGLKPGTRVKQGQVIGTVGTTGRSTGPHLHYEVHVNDSQVNPMQAKLPAGNPLPKKYRSRFQSLVASTQKLWSQKAVQLANADVEAEIIGR